MGVTLTIRDVDPTTKARLSADAERVGMSLTAYLRLKLDEMASPRRRAAGSLSSVMQGVRDPVDGWTAMSDEELQAWEGEDERPSP